jgi:hypothetical protein
MSAAASASSLTVVPVEKVAYIFLMKRRYSENAVAW